MRQGGESQRVSTRSVAQGLLSRWGIHVRFGHRADEHRSEDAAPRPASAPARAVERAPAPDTREDTAPQAVEPAPTAGERLAAPSRHPLFDPAPGPPPRAVLFDDVADDAPRPGPADEAPRPRPADDVRGIFAHSAPPPPAPPQPRIEASRHPVTESRPASAPEPRPERRVEPSPQTRVESRREPTTEVEERPRRVTIVDTQVRRRKMRGSIGLVLGWRNEALHKGTTASQASLTVMRLSIDIHMRTRAARIDYAKTFSLALGREVGSSHSTPITRAERAEARAVEEAAHEEPPHEEPLHERPRVDRFRETPQVPADQSERRDVDVTYRAPIIPGDDSNGGSRAATGLFAPSLRVANGHGPHRCSDGAYGPGN